MTNPENRNLNIFEDELHINNPLAFSQDAWKEILTYQICSKSQMEILIKNGKKRELISRQELTTSRCLDDGNFDIYLDDIVDKIQNAEQIIIMPADNRTEKKSDYLSLKAKYFETIIDNTTKKTVGIILYPQLIKTVSIRESMLENVLKYQISNSQPREILINGTRDPQTTISHESLLSLSQHPEQEMSRKISSLIYEKKMLDSDAIIIRIPSSAAH